MKTQQLLDRAASSSALANHSALTALNQSRREQSVSVLILIEWRAQLRDALDAVEELETLAKDEAAQKGKT